VLYGSLLPPLLVQAPDEGGPTQVVGLVPVADPFNRIREAYVLHRPGEDSIPNEYTPMTGAERVPLPIGPRGARLLMELPPGPGIHLIQLAFTDVDGKTVVSRPLAYSLAGSSGNTVRNSGGGLDGELADAVSVAEVARFPDHFQGEEITLKVTLSGGVTAQGNIGPNAETFTLDVGNELGAAIRDLRFTTTRAIASGVHDMALGGEHFLVLATAQVGEKSSDDPRTPVHITKVQFLTPDGRAALTLPLSKETHLLATVTRDPTQFYGQTLTLDTLFVGVEHDPRKGAYRVNVTNLRGVSPLKINLLAPEALGIQLMNEGLSNQKKYLSRLIVTVPPPDSAAGTQEVHVFGVDFLDIEGNVIKAFR
jgi:hypothetical protein